MEIKKGYKQTEIGIIPEDWEVKRLEALTNAIGDGLHGTPVYDDNGLFSFINGNNIKNGKIECFSDTKLVSKKEFLKYKKDLGNGTLLLSINGTIGNVAYYNNEEIVLGKSVAYIVSIRKPSIRLHISA